jgi:hypothetical protein
MDRMRKTGRKAALGAAMTAVMAIGLGGTAQATYHENLVTEIHQGSGIQTGDFVELQAYAAGQNFVKDRYVATYDGGGGLLTQVQFPANLANGANQAHILVAHDVSTPGADVVDATLNVVNTGGYVCFTDTVLTTGLDCVASGHVSGLPSVSPSGTPAPVGAALTDAQSLTRSIARGCATTLDLADDTNNSAADFALAAPTPTGNAATPTETPCPTPPAKTKKCKKKKKKGKSGAAVAKKKKCKKKKKK